ncbi:MAG: 50S ribosomal protein L15 [Patescibacteria group bacterium]
MQVHELKPKHYSKGKKRVGRGGKKGTYSGRGGKGQTARSGRKMEPFIREIIKRYPKLKGYRRCQLPYSLAVVNLGLLDKNFKDGQVINPSSLIEKGIVRMIKGRTPEIKILGDGGISRKLIIENCKVSKSAKEAIEKLGGVIK